MAATRLKASAFLFEIFLLGVNKYNNLYLRLVMPSSGLQSPNGQLFLVNVFRFKQNWPTFLVDLLGFLNWPTFSCQCAPIQTKLANFFGRSVWILKLANFFGNLFRFKQNWPTFLVDLFGFLNWPTFSCQCVSIQTKLANFFGRSVWIQ